jgi:hypothetical protein
MKGQVATKKAELKLRSILLKISFCGPALLEGLHAQEFFCHLRCKALNEVNPCSRVA